MTNVSNQEFYKKIGAQGLKKISEEYTVHDDIAFVVKNSTKDEKILDLGCGYGRVAIELSRLGYKHLTGIDLAENLIADAKKEITSQHLDIRFDIGDITTLPYKDMAFDKIFCLWNVFNEIYDKDSQLKTLAETYRVLKPKGKAFFTMRDEETDPSTPIKKDELNGIDIYQFIHTKDTLRELLKESLFTDCTIDSIHLNNRQRILMVLVK